MLLRKVLFVYFSLITLWLFQRIEVLVSILSIVQYRIRRLRRGSVYGCRAGGPGFDILCLDWNKKLSFRAF